MNENNELNGIKGWLVYIGLSIIVSLIQMLFIYIPFFKEILVDGRWQMFSNIESAFYSPFIYKLIIVELVFHSLKFISYIFLIYLFYINHYLFPKLYIVVIIISLIFMPFDEWMLSEIYHDIITFDSETIKLYIKSLVRGAIIISYLIYSKRVKYTFVER